MTRTGPAVSALVAALASACAPEPTPAPAPVALTATAPSETAVEIVFSRAPEPDAGAELASALAAFAVFEAALDPLPIEAASLAGPVLSLTTAPQIGGRTYAVRLRGAFSDPEVPAQATFVGFGRARVEIALDVTGLVAPDGLVAEITADPATGRYHDEVHSVPLSPAGDRRVATLDLVVDPGRVFSARARGADGAEASDTRTFTVTSTAPVRVELSPRLPPVPEFAPPVDPVVGDGVAPVRIVLDDRPARALRRPGLRLTLDAEGRFDLAAARAERVRAIGPRVHEVVVDVRVDPKRRLDGTSADTFPYIALLTEADATINERTAAFEMVDETPKVVVLTMGNPELVPVTFRVEAGSAWLEPDGALRGRYPGEGIFLTGEFNRAEDAFGRIAADAFSGGERDTLEMDERPDAPGVFEKTLFLPPNRPYGWKVVRCPTGLGCGELNRRVSSSGRAFPTVMKNLTNQNLDASLASDVSVVDPAHPERGIGPDGQPTSYAAARVSLSGSEPPSSAVLFKQEAPDLVVTVGARPVVTPIYVVGTWRDVNIPERPADIIAGGLTIELGPFDYDDGLAGRAPLIRELDLPLDPGVPVRPAGDPPFQTGDGQPDGGARQLSTPAGRLPLWLASNGRELYVATAAPTPDVDHFVVVYLDPPTGARPSPWAKRGQVPGGPRVLLLAAEGAGDFVGWFRHEDGGATLVEEVGFTAGRGTVIEGAAPIEPLPAKVYVAAIAYGTRDADPLIPEAQTPPGDGGFSLEAGELLEIELEAIRIP